MKLEGIIQKVGFRPAKIILPSNNGMMQMRPDPYKALGISNKDADSYDYVYLAIEKYRAEDIPRICDSYTANRVPVLGLTGDDLFDEYKLRQSATRLRVVDTIDWMIPLSRKQIYSRPTLCLISIEGKTLEELTPEEKIVVNKKYMFTALEYLEQLNCSYTGKFKNIVPISGKLENCIPLMGNFGIEIVLSGNTLRYADKNAKTKREPELVILEEIRQSDMSVITSWQPELSTTYVEATDAEDVLLRQYSTIENRFLNPTESYTSELLQNPNMVIKKFGEETAELVAAFATADPRAVANEMQDVLYALQCVGVNRGVRWTDVLTAVNSRQNK